MEIHHVQAKRACTVRPYQGYRYASEGGPLSSGSTRYTIEYKEKVLEDENKQIKQELEQVSELTDIKAKEEEILQRQASIIAKDSGVQLLKQKLGKILKELRNAGSSTVE